MCFIYVYIIERGFTVNKTFKCLLSLLLAVLMVTSNGLTAYANTLPEGGEKPVETTEEQGDLNYVDPETLNVPKLGDDYSDNAEEYSLYGQNDTVRVSIVLDSPSVLDAGYSTEGYTKNQRAKFYRNRLKTEQAYVEKNIETALKKELDVVWNLTLLINVISANVRYGDIEDIKKVAGVKDVFVENIYQAYAQPEELEPRTSMSSEMTGATAAWESGYTGAGSKVAILDTGVNQDHISFDPAALEYSLTKDGKSLDDYDLLTLDGILEVLDELNADGQYIIDARRAYRNVKIPFAYNYGDKNYITDHSAGATSNHGSHVAGIAAANRYVKVDGQFVDAIDEEFAVGMAPDAQIFAMKVFKAGGGAADSDYTAAIEDAIILGADSINLSLGSNVVGNTFTSIYKDLFDRLEQTGSVVAIAAGNTGAWSSQLPLHPAVYIEDPNFATIGSPATYFNSLAVASAQNIGMTGTPLIFDGDNKGFYMETESGAARMTSIAGTYDYVYIDGIGTPEEYAAVNAVLPLAGKVVLINRGEISFVEKGNNAKEYNPKALVVFNHEPGLMGMALSGYTGTFPMVLSLLSTAEKIKENSTQHTAGDVNYYTGSVEVTDEISTGIVSTKEEASISDFSSWGAPGSLIMKPEITAPGGNIWSVNGSTTDGYVSNNGTSMATPHIAGLAAVLGQYIEENGLEEKLGYNKRFISQALLMSTAIPMIGNDEDLGSYYYPVLSQGAGFADVGLASLAKTLITMADDASSEATDGKVKVEFGQDAKREGVYTYVFKITNFADVDLEYELNTDIFTQLPTADEEGNIYLLPYTALLDADVTYDWEKTLEDHDVNKDGVTNDKDAQAILDYLTGKLTADDINTDKADFDEDGRISSLDAFKLLKWLEENNPDTLIVKPMETKEVTVTITLSDDDKDFLDSFYTGGAYIEGFTYASTKTTTDEGAYVDPVEYSIPLLGYYGSWTDGSMYETTKYTDLLYGSTQYPYFGNLEANALLLTYPGEFRSIPFTGNPYIVEDEFPADRLALSSKTMINGFSYTLIRNADILQALAFNDDGILYSSNAVNGSYGAFYDDSDAAWKLTSSYLHSIRKNVEDFGVSEGDKFTLSLFAIPEYYGLQKNIDDPSLTTEEYFELYKQGEIGEGATIGYTFTVDDHAPVIHSAEWTSEKVLHVVISDNQYIAFAGITDILGSNPSHYDSLPEQTEPGQTYEFDIDMTDMDDITGTALFVADYAGNETAVLVGATDGPVTVFEEVPVYELTDTLEPNGEYIIANRNTEGTAKVMQCLGDQYYVVSANVTIHKDSADEKPYVFASEVEDDIVWLTEEENVLSSKGFSGVYPTLLTTYELASFEDPQAAIPYFYNSEKAQFGINIASLSKLGATAQSNNRWKMTANFTKMYLYTPAVKLVPVEIDPNQVASIEINPGDTTLIIDVKESVDFTTTITPIVAPDKSVTWTSSDPGVATVDANGHVEAVNVGVTTITATSNLTPTVSSSVTVTVVKSQPMDAVVNGMIETEDGVKFVTIDLNDMSTTTISDEPFSWFYGGGRSGDYIFGNDVDDDFHAYNAANGYAYEESMHLALNHEDAVRDVANIVDIADKNGDYAYISLSNDNALDIMDASGRGYVFTFESDTPQWVAVAFIGLDEDDAGTLYYCYWLLGDDGTLLELDFYVEDDELQVKEYDFGRVTGLSFGDDLTAYSMTCAQSQTQKSGVFLADNTVQGIYYIEFSATLEHAAKYVGRLDNTTGLSTLYDDLFDVVNDLSSTAAPLAAMNTAKRESGKYGLTMTRVEKVDSDKKAEPLYGGIKSTEEAKKNALDLTDFTIIYTAPKPDDDDGYEYVAVVITEEEKAYNGLYELTYDPNELTYLDYHCDVANYYSVNVDAANGKITFSYADTEGFDAGIDLIEFQFAPNCEDKNVTVKTVELNDNLDYNQTNEVPVNGEGHKWGEPTWEWEDDHSAATATFTCERNSDHVKTVTEDAVVTTVDPTMETEGSKTYTVTVTGPDGKTYTTTYTETLPKVVWSEPEWKWSNDHNEATATFTDNYGNEVELPAEVTVETNEDGSKTYTATVVGPDGKTYTTTWNSPIPLGDNSHLGMYIAMMAVSAAGLAILLKKRKESVAE